MTDFITNIIVLHPRFSIINKPNHLALWNINMFCPLCLAIINTSVWKDTKKSIFSDHLNIWVVFSNAIIVTIVFPATNWNRFPFLDMWNIPIMASITRTLVNLHYQSSWQNEASIFKWNSRFLIPSPHWFLCCTNEEHKYFLNCITEWLPCHTIVL